MSAATPPRSVLVLGGRSDIGLAIAHRYAAGGASVVLAARDPADLARAATDIEIRHKVSATVVPFDAVDPDPDRFLDSLAALPDTVVCAVGLLGDQARSEADPAAATAVMEANYLGPARVLGAVANRMAARGTGCIVGISSVAGDRGRASNYVYGSAKAGFTAFLSGLRNRLARTGVHVVTVKPGFVRTRMTEGMPLPGPITAAPAEVGEAVYRADLKRRNTIHVRPVWRLIMLVIGAIPEPIFKRLSL